MKIDEKTMRKLYVCSNPSDEQIWLIGVLTELKPDGFDESGKYFKGEYQFEYKLGGKKREWFLRLDEFPDINRVYRGDEVRKFVDRILPGIDNRYLDGFLKAANLENYNEWGFLKYCGKWDPRGFAFISEEKPKGLIIYED